MVLLCETIDSYLQSFVLRDFHGATSVNLCSTNLERKDLDRC